MAGKADSKQSLCFFVHFNGKQKASEKTDSLTLKIMFLRLFNFADWH